MNYLVPCPNCARHVRQSESACPFCSAELTFQHLSPPVLPRGRLGRAATFAFGASLVGATSLVACGGESETSKSGSGGATSHGGSTSGGNNSAGHAGAGRAGSFNGEGGNIAQPYGVPPFGGSAQPTYGAPPFGGFGGIGNGGTGNGGTGGSSGDGSSGEGGDGGDAAGGANAGTAGSGGPQPVYGGPP